MTTAAKRVTYTALAAGAAAAAFLVSGTRAVPRLRSARPERSRRGAGRRDKYRVLFRQGPFELRAYPHNDLTAATAGPRLVTPGEPQATQQLAAYRYSSWPAPDREATAVQNLRDWAAAHGYLVEGRPIATYYDADWTPPILRRNEVLLRVRG